MRDRLLTSLVCGAVVSAALCGPAMGQGMVPVGEAIDASLGRYLEESDAALDSRMADLRRYFEERKAGTRKFAQSVLSIEGKLMMGGGAIQEIYEAAAGGEQKAPLRKYIGDRLRDADVLDPAEAKKATDEAVEGFLGDMAAIEGRILVKLKADVGDDDLALPATVRNLEGAGMRQYEAMVGSTIDDALADIGVSLGMFVASNYVSGKVVDGIMKKDTSEAGKFLANVIIGIAVDKVMDEAAKAAGYDAEKKLAEKAAAGIDRVRAAVIDGEFALFKCYPTLSLFRRAHPDKAVRDACERADEALVRSFNFGLRERLLRLRNDRYRRLWVVLTGRLVGPEAAESPFLMYAPLDAGKSTPAGDVIRWADSITEACRGIKQ